MGRLRVGRIRPRRLDWVVDGTPVDWRGNLIPSTAGGEEAVLHRLLAPVWSPNLRVLEICSETPLLLAEARSHQVAEYWCLPVKPPWQLRDELRRTGSTLLEGCWRALAKVPQRFDLIAWLRDNESAPAPFQIAESLLVRNGFLAALVGKRLGREIVSQWSIENALALPRGGQAILARRAVQERAA
jgi:hypothetical protein